MRAAGTIALSLACAWPAASMDRAGPTGAGIAVSRAPNPPAAVKPDPSFIVLLRLRHDLWLKFKASGKWPQDDRAANAALAEHGRYWAAERDAGRAVLAGGMGGDHWDNVALIVIRAPSLAAAQARVAADPAVRSYVFQADVRPFDISWVRAPG